MDGLDKEPILEPDEEITDEQLEEAEQNLAAALIGDSGIILSKDAYRLLKKSEDYAQDLAVLAVRYFKTKDAEIKTETRKLLILKSVDFLKMNPAPGFKHVDGDVHDEVEKPIPEKRPTNLVPEILKSKS